MIKKREGSWADWIQDGRIAFICWVLVLIAFVYTKAVAHVDDPDIKTAFVLFNGVIVGYVGVVKGGKKNDKENEDQ